MRYYWRYWYLLPNEYCLLLLLFNRNKRKNQQKFFPVVWVLKQIERKQDPEYVGESQDLGKLPFTSCKQQTMRPIQHQPWFEVIQCVEEDGHGEPKQNKNNPMYQRCVLGSFLLLKYRERLGLCLMGRCWNTQRPLIVKNPPSTFYQERDFNV